jgi:hypothetical protein
VTFALTQFVCDFSAFQHHIWLTDKWHLHHLRECVIFLHSNITSGWLTSDICTTLACELCFCTPTSHLADWQVTFAPPQQVRHVSAFQHHIWLTHKWHLHLLSLWVMFLHSNITFGWPTSDICITSASVWCYCIPTSHLADPQVTFALPQRVCDVSAFQHHIWLTHKWHLHLLRMCVTFLHSNITSGSPPSHICVTSESVWCVCMSPSQLANPQMTFASSQAVCDFSTFHHHSLLTHMLQLHYLRMCVTSLFSQLAGCSNKSHSHHLRLWVYPLLYLYFLMKYIHWTFFFPIQPLPTLTYASFIQHNTIFFQQVSIALHSLFSAVSHVPSLVPSECRFLVLQLPTRSLILVTSPAIHLPGCEFILFPSLDICQLTFFSGCMSLLFILWHSCPLTFHLECVLYIYITFPAHTSILDFLCIGSECTLPSSLSNL